MRVPLPPPRPATSPPAPPSPPRPALAPAWAALLLCPGCAQLFGLDERRLAPPDAGATASLRVDQVFLGSTVETRPFDVAASTASFLVPDAAEPSGLRRVPATAAAVDTWTAELPADATAYPLYTLAGPGADAAVARAVQLPRGTYRVPQLDLGHPDHEPAPAGAALDFAITLDAPLAAGDALSWFTVGSWTARAFEPAELPAPGELLVDPPAIAFASARPLGDRPADRLITSDVVMVLRHAGTTLTGAMVAPSFTQADAPQQITGNLVAIPADHTLDVTLTPEAAARRLARTQPTPQVDAAVTSWAVTAAPGHALGVGLGPLLTSGQLAAGAPAHVSAPYANPFEGRTWATTLTVTTAARRTYQPPPPAPPIELRAGLEVVGDVPAAGAEVAAEACLPLLVTLGDNALVYDDDALALDRARGLELAFVADRPTATAYAATVFELVAGETSTAFVPRFEVTGDRPRFAVPPEVFEAGKRYAIRARCIQGGLAGLADGDLTRRSLPVSTGFLDSAVFTVMP